MDESIAITLDNHCNNALLSLLYFLENVLYVMLKRTYKKSFFCKRIGGYEQKRHTKVITLQLKRYVCKDVILSMALNQINKLVWIVETIPWRWV